MRRFELELTRHAKAFAYLHDDLSPYCKTHERHPVLIVLPGGGYQHLSPREGEPVAMRFFSHSYDCFILHYPIGEALRDEGPVEALEALVDEILKNADEWRLDTTRMAVMGFSAGAHATASYVLLSKDCKAKAMVLGYPVITSGPYAHRGSFDTLCAGDKAKLERYSLENQVTEATPPAFIFHSSDDKSVDVRNSLLFCQALAAKGVPFELHVWPHGIHGSSICTQEVGTANEDMAAWTGLCLKWLSKTLDFSE